MSAGTDVRVGGIVLPGGLLYVGTGLLAANGRAVEPALIDPRLDVDFQPCERPGKPLPNVPAYDQLTPANRAGYLRWLATGRSLPDAPLGYVFLYFYGLERRLLVDAPPLGGTSPACRVDVEGDLIRTEIRRLLAVYGRHRSFHDYATNLLDSCLPLGSLPRYRSAPPGPSARVRDLPVALRLGLGQLVADELPISAEWALAWWFLHPATRPRMPVRQCPAEFTETFTEFYTDMFGDGLLLERGGPRLRWSYLPASAGIAGPFRFEVDVPDVAAMTTAFRQIDQIAQQTTNALATYSRFIARHPNAVGTPQALALLPEYTRWLVAPPDPDTGSDSGSDPAAVSEAVPRSGAVSQPGVSAVPGAPASPDAVLGSRTDPHSTAGPRSSADPGRPPVLAAVPGSSAPDTRDPLATVVLPGQPAGGFALPPRIDAPASLDPDATVVLPSRLTDAFPPPPPTAMDMLSRLMAAFFPELSGPPADGHPSPPRPGGQAVPNPDVTGTPSGGLALANDAQAGEASGASDRAPASTSSSAQEPVPPQFQLDREQLAAKMRESEEVSALLGGIFTESADTAVPRHPPAVTAGCDDDGRRGVPNRVRPAPVEAAVPRSPIPADSGDGRNVSSRVVPAVYETAGPGHVLAATADGGGGRNVSSQVASAAPDEAAVPRSPIPADSDGDGGRNVSDRVASAGGSLVPESSTQNGRNGVGGPESVDDPDGLDSLAARRDAMSVPGLDEAHSALLVSLRSAPAWSRSDFTALAASFHLLPDGAIDALNEVAVEMAGEPVCEGGDPIEMNPYALEEMFG